MVCALLVFGLGLARAAESNASATQRASDDGEVVFEEESPEKLQSMLNWAIANSDPTKLKEMASGQARESGDAARRKEEIAEIMHAVNSQPSEADLMKEAVEILRGSGDETAATGALSLLVNLVTQIDLANDFLKIDGISALASAWGRSCEEIRALAYECLGTAASNNIEFQEGTLSASPDLIRVLARALESEPEDAVRIKIVFALSSLLRISVRGRNDFYAMDGPKILANLVQIEAGASSAVLRRKALTLCLDLQSLEREFDIKSFSSYGFALSLKSLLVAATREGDRETIERCLLMIQALARYNPATIDHFARADVSSAISKWVPEGQKGGGEYERELVQLASQVLLEIGKGGPGKNEL